MIIEDDYKIILDKIAAEFPEFKIIAKDTSSLMKTIDVMLKIITFGQMNSFMLDFTTTLGTKIYTPSTWVDMPVEAKITILRHELIHMRQARRYGRFLFSFLYLIFPLPVVFAYYRAKFEKEAYEESLRAIHEYRGPKAFTSGLKSRVLSHFTTAQYFWMWPWKKGLSVWYDSVVDRIKSEK